MQHIDDELITSVNSEPWPCTCTRTVDHLSLDPRRLTECLPARILLVYWKATGPMPLSRQVHDSLIKGAMEGGHSAV